jgi:hypothetical protein
MKWCNDVMPTHGMQVRNSSEFLVLLLVNTHALLPSKGGKPRPRFKQTEGDHAAAMLIEFRQCSAELVDTARVCRLPGLNVHRVCLSAAISCILCTIF